MSKNRIIATTKSLMQLVKFTIRKPIWIIVIAFAALAPAYAQLAPLDTLPVDVGPALSIDAEIVDDPPVVKRNQVWGVAHSTLGWLTVITGLAAGILNPENASRSVHEALGYTSASLAAATLTLGGIAYHDKVGVNKSSSNNIHAWVFWGAP